MAKKWYPIVDYVECAECGLCINKCPHSVYDKEKSPSPIVVNPDGCIEGCHGCGNLSPQGAITYVGDNSDWTPPHGEKKEGDCGCSCGCPGGCS